MLTLIDEYNRECLAIEVQRRLSSEDVVYAVPDAMLKPGVPRCMTESGCEIGGGPTFEGN